MNKEIRKEMKLRYFLLKNLPKPLISIIVKLKGGGVLDHPVYVKPINPNSLECTIAYNTYGAFCTPNSCKTDEPVQTTYRGEQYESKTIEYIKSLSITGDIIHAGAYFGDTIPALSNTLSEGGILWAFEPKTESFRCAQITILLNKLNNVKLHNFGIGKSNETLNLLITNQGNHLGGTSRVVSNKTTDTQKISVQKLDDVIPKERPVSVIHIDVEGYEEAALSGAREILHNHKPLIITEVTDGVTIPLMKKIGYKFVCGLEKKQWKNDFRNAVFKHV